MTNRPEAYQGEDASGRWPVILLLGTLSDGRNGDRRGSGVQCSGSLANLFRAILRNVRDPEVDDILGKVAGGRATEADCTGGANLAVGGRNCDPPERFRLVGEFHSHTPVRVLLECRIDCLTVVPDILRNLIHGEGGRCGGLLVRNVREVKRHG